MTLDSFDDAFDSSFDILDAVADPYCGWEPLYSDCDCEGTCCHLNGLSPTMTDAILGAATRWLWEATNRRFGNCPVTIRPCMKDCYGGYTGGTNIGAYPAWIPYRTTSGWFNVSCGRCGNNCSCGHVSTVKLPTTGFVHEVTLDGVTMDAEDWRLDNRQYLLRLDGGVWPSCQDMAADPPTWAVTYTPGLPVPLQGQIALGQLVCQMARLACGDKCQLPAGVVSVVRQGVTVNIAPTTEAVTGLWLIDSWMGMVNRAPARVWWPEMTPTRVAAL
jgi:hypothetical protein